MKEEIKVSVCCLAYNHELYIRDCLEGFVKQKTNFKYEVLIHDDASTDKTVDIIREYEAKYPDIIKPIYQSENRYSQGISIDEKYIFPKAKGKYYAYCEGDDYWCNENKLQKQVDFMDAHPEYSACVHNSFRLNCTSGEKTLISKAETDCDLSVEDMILRFSEYFQTSSVFYRKEYALLPDGFKSKSFGDYQKAIYLALCGKVRYMNDIMSVYRFLSNGSWSQKQSETDVKINHNNEVINLMYRLDEYTEQEYHEVIEKKILSKEVEILSLEKEYSAILKNAAYRKEYIRTCGLKGWLFLCKKTMTAEKNEQDT